MTKIYQSVTELVGQTPIVKLSKFSPAEGATIYAKVESFNPGSSVKDRIALSMIEAAEKAGTLKPGDTIIEPTSGNTGIGLSMIGAAKGYQVIIVMPDTMSVERRKLMQAYGAKLILTPGSEGIKGSINKATELAKENGYFMPLQFENPENPKIHELTTGKEIVEAFGPEGIDAFVAGVGTGGTISGVGKALKAAYSQVKVYAVEPKESAVLSGENPGAHKIQGIGTGFVPKTLDTEIYDQVLPVASDDAILTARNFGKQEGILVGISSGAALKAAYDVAKGLSKDEKVLVLLPDNGERYLSTALYQFED